MAKKFLAGDRVVFCPPNNVNAGHRGKQEGTILSIKRGGFEEEVPVQWDDGVWVWREPKLLKHTDICHDCKYRLQRLVGDRCPDHYDEEMKNDE